ncbi:MAG: hypothetical protein GY694_09870 [Gammaproteobacteria bacterium]|nr:hypothetical protein [Gammaproteobacteria bacterium]
MGAVSHPKSSAARSACAIGFALPEVWLSKNFWPNVKSLFPTKRFASGVTHSVLCMRRSGPHGINSNLIVKWKKQLIDQSSEVFASAKGLAPDRESEIHGLQAKIGQLTMGNDILAKVLGR